MEINKALILAAGKGTRMGKIGEVLPKLLWPIGDETLLFYKIEQLKSLGIKEIFVNIYFLAEQFEEYVRNRDFGVKLTLVREKSLLGSGGAIHNLRSCAHVNDRDYLLSTIGDHFFSLEKENLSLVKAKLSQVDAAIFCADLGKKNYNQTQIKDGRLVKILSEYNEQVPTITYTGHSIINFSRLRHVEGESSFFSSVADYKNREVGASVLGGIEEIDFGTLPRYVSSVEELYKEDFKERRPHLHKLLCKAPVNILKNGNIFTSGDFSLSREEEGFRLRYKDTEDFFKA